MQRQYAQYVEPIIRQVKAKTLRPQSAIGCLDRIVEPERPHLEYDFERFLRYSGEVFCNEKYFETSYRLWPDEIYEYKRPSQVDAHFLYILHKDSGLDYFSTRQLKEQMKSILYGKTLLELGCGPGFGLKLFEELGAKVQGVDLRTSDSSKLGLDVIASDIYDLPNIGGFDIIYSHDLFSSRYTGKYTRQDSDEMANRLESMTSENGLNIHIINLERKHPLIVELASWIRAFEHNKHDKWAPLHKTSEVISESPKPTLFKESLSAYKNLEWYEANGELVMKWRKR